MNKYETLFIIDSNLEEDAIKSLVEKFKNLLETSAKLESIEEWGKRKLAYPVKFRNEGYYVLTYFEATPDFPSELERIFKITDGILKYLILKR